MSKEIYGCNHFANVGEMVFDYGERCMKRMYGCNTRQPGYVGRQESFLVQDGYHTTDWNKTPKFVRLPNRMSKKCRYDRIAIDPGCEGCEEGRKALERKNNT